MLVRDLIAQLEQMPQDVEVCIFDNSGQFFERLKKANTQQVKAHYNCFTSLRTHRFQSEYVAELKKKSDIKIVALYY